MALDGLKFMIEEEPAPRTRIRVFGVGGGGSNAVARMMDQGLGGVEFCVLNTDAQALEGSPVSSKLAIGSKITHGLGAGSDPAVVRQAVQGISDIINMPGLVNRDFSDVRSIMTGMGYAMMGTSSARGENACVAAAQKAIHSPLMDGGGLHGARGVLINITASSELGLHQVNKACNLV